MTSAIQIGTIAIRVLREIAVRDGLHGHVWRREFALAVEPDHFSKLVETADNAVSIGDGAFEAVECVINAAQRSTGHGLNRPLAGIFWKATKDAIGGSVEPTKGTVEIAFHCRDALGNCFGRGGVAGRWFGAQNGRRLTHGLVPFFVDAEFRAIHGRICAALPPPVCSFRWPGFTAASAVRCLSGRVRISVADCCIPGGSNPTGEAGGFACLASGDQRLSLVGLGGRGFALPDTGGDFGIITERWTESSAFNPVKALNVQKHGALAERLAKQATLVAGQSLYGANDEYVSDLCVRSLQTSKSINPIVGNDDRLHTSAPDGHSGLPLLAMCAEVVATSHSQSQKALRLPLVSLFLAHDEPAHEHRQKSQRLTIGGEAVRSSVATGAEDIGLVHAKPPSKGDSTCRQKTGKSSREASLTFGRSMRSSSRTSFAPYETKDCRQERLKACCKTLTQPAMKFSMARMTSFMPLAFWQRSEAFSRAETVERSKADGVYIGLRDHATGPSQANAEPQALHFLQSGPVIPRGDVGRVGWLAIVGRARLWPLLPTSLTSESSCVPTMSSASRSLPETKSSACTCRCGYSAWPPRDPSGFLPTMMLRAKSLGCGSASITPRAPSPKGHPWPYGGCRRGGFPRPRAGPGACRFREACETPC